MTNPHETLTLRIVRKFLESNLSMVFILVSLAAGIIALLVTPREEEPQITVAAANVMVSFPGRTASDVEQLVSTPLERMLLQIPGVQYVYSRSMPGQSIVTVRFYVGEPLEPSYVKLIRKLNENIDRITPGAAAWVVKPVDVDDVPIVTFTLTSSSHDDYSLRRMADEVVLRLQSVPNAGTAYVVGGRPRELLIRPSATRMAAYGISALEISRAIQASNTSVLAGTFDRDDRGVRVQAGQFIADARDLRELVVGASNGRPIYLREVADVTDGPGEFLDYVRFHRGQAWSHPKVEGSAGSLVGGPARAASGAAGSQPGVTIAVAKKHGSNNVWVAQDLIRRMEELKKTVLPADVDVVITRNYGITANAKVKELEEGLLVAIAVVMALLTLGLGYRQAVVVAIAVPCVFGLTLIVSYFLGFSINRISLFALTIAIGLLVDDPIVDVENIHRHFQMRGKSTTAIVLEAINEVRPPLIAATFAVILSFLPLLLVTDMMGQYLRPMAANVPVTMLMSLVVSFTITPWLAYHMLRRHAGNHVTAAATGAPPLTARFFRRFLMPLLQHRWLGRMFLLMVVGLFAGSVLLVLTRQVRVKQLPYDNKDEILLVLDMPAGTPLERTDAVARDFEHYLASVPEITDYETYVGTSSPVDFNGMMRQYFLRRAPNRADIRVNLIHKTERVHSSHSIALRLRPGLTAIANRHGAKLKIVELPAGPPAMSTIVAAVYGAAAGNSCEDLVRAAAIVKERMSREPGIVDLDDTIDEDQTKLVFEVDKEKAALNGISTDEISRTIALALGSQNAGIAQIPHERTPVRIALWFPRAERSSAPDLSRIYVKGAGAHMVPLSELGFWRTELEDKTIYHRQMERVVYVLGEMAGRPPVETILDLRADEILSGNQPFVDTNAKPRTLASRTMFRKGGGIGWRVPKEVNVRWWDEGEMYITLNLFRDLALAMLVALAGIYVILMNQTGSYQLPVVIMLSIPLMVIGVLPGFWLLNQLGERSVGGLMNPVFFSGPAFMGMIALAGIVTRNSIIIVDFIHLALMRGLPLDQAILESVSVRLRPILLTSGAAVLGALPITLDTVFGGMAWSLIFGLVVSAAFSVFVIPVTYNLMYAGKPDHGLPEQIRKKLAESHFQEAEA
ncbi:MAG: efflux RND transporter permease subunit [Bryobacteraceae bacterium]